MASENQNLSTLAQSEDLGSAKGMRVGVVVAMWNKDITEALLGGAVETLQNAGCSEIVVKWVPGAFELPLGAQAMFHADEQLDAVVVLGCVVRGGTPHFDYVCDGATQGVIDVQLKYNKPVGFGLLTVDDMEQALDRAGGRFGNKGDEAAATVVEMLAMMRTLAQ